MGEVWIMCPVCRTVSHNPNDVKYGYCARCHAFHEDLLRELHSRRRRGKQAPETATDPRQTTIDGGNDAA